MNIKISPSLLSADMSRLYEEVTLIAEKADYVHCDVMDGHFVPNLTFGAPVIAALKKHDIIPLDVHLMIETPAKWIDDYLFQSRMGADDFLTIHIEADDQPDDTLQRIRAAGVRPGLAVKPGTSLQMVVSLWNLIDQILIMTVEPGFGGQKFMAEVLPKIKEARSLIRPHQVIGVDGGISPATAELVSEAGADLLVAGGAVYGTDDPLEAIDNIRRSALDGYANRNL